MLWQESKVHHKAFPKPKNLHVLQSFTLKETYEVVFTKRDCLKFILHEMLGTVHEPRANLSGGCLRQSTSSSRSRYIASTVWWPLSQMQPETQDLKCQASQKWYSCLKLSLLIYFDIYALHLRQLVDTVCHLKLIFFFLSFNTDHMHRRSHNRDIQLCQEQTKTRQIVFLQTDSTQCVIGLNQLNQTWSGSSGLYEHCTQFDK